MSLLKEFKTDELVVVASPTTVHELEGYKGKEGTVVEVHPSPAVTLIEVAIDGAQETFQAEELDHAQVQA